MDPKFGLESHVFVIKAKKKARKSILTKLCPLVGSGILYMDHPNHHSLFDLGLPGKSYLNKTNGLPFWKFLSTAHEIGRLEKKEIISKKLLLTDSLDSS